MPIDSIKYDTNLLAVEEGINFAKSCGPEVDTELIFLHVLHSDSDIPIEERGKIEKLDKKGVKAEFEEIEEMCKKNGLNNFRSLIEKGKPHVEIIKTAQEEDIDTIVIGSGKLHNRNVRGKFEKFMYGSVTEKVIHEAPCSILVVRP